MSSLKVCRPCKLVRIVVRRRHHNYLENIPLSQIFVVRRGIWSGSGGSPPTHPERRVEKQQRYQGTSMPDNQPAFFHCDPHHSHHIVRWDTAQSLTLHYEDTDGVCFGEEGALNHRQNNFIPVVQLSPLAVCNSNTASMC